MELFQRMVHDETDNEADLPVSAVPGYEARGWRAVGEPRTRAQIDDGPTVAAQEAAAAELAAKSEVDVSAPVAAVLEQVGDDPVRARVALAAEQEQDKPRVTLTAPLEQIAGADEAGTTEGESDG